MSLGIPDPMTDERSWPLGVHRATMRAVGSRRQRQIDRAAVAGLVPVVAVLPIFLLAMAPFWWLVRRFVAVDYLLAVGLYVLAGASCSCRWSNAGSSRV